MTFCLNSRGSEYRVEAAADFEQMVKTTIEQQHRCFSGWSFLDNLGNLTQFAQTLHCPRARMLFVVTRIRSSHNHSFLLKPDQDGQNRFRAHVGLFTSRRSWIFVLSYIPALVRERIKNPRPYCLSIRMNTSQDLLSILVCSKTHSKFQRQSLGDLRAAKSFRL